MERTRKKMTLIVAVAVSLSTLLLWAATGFHSYTKYQVVEVKEVAIEANDPFAETGLYDEETKTQTVQRDEFHLGLLPTPQGLFDKHLVSVASIVLPVWTIAGVILWLDRRSRRKSAEQPNRDSSPEA